MNNLSRTALAAGAIKLGGFAAFNAEAGIIATTLATPVVINNTTTTFDVNNDGQMDLAIFHQSSFSDVITGGDGLIDSIVAAQAGGFMVDPAIVDAILPLGFGDPIDASGAYKSGGFAAVNQYDNPRDGNRGYWANGGAVPANWPGPDQPYRGYMGFSFVDLANDLHYAWADVGVAAYNPNDLSSYETTVYGYGYETVANTGIPAGVPEPASLALLALGAASFIGRKKLAA